MPSSASRLSWSRPTVATASTRPPRRNRTAQSFAPTSPSTASVSHRSRVADVVDRHLVVQAPEERHGVEPVAQSEDVARGCLALALRHHPVLHADALAGVGIRPAGDVPGREDAGCAGLEPRIDHQPAVEREPGGFSQRQVRPHPDARDEQVGGEPLAALEDHRPTLHRAGLLAQVEDDPLRFVHPANHVAQLRPHDPRERPLVGRDHVHLHFPGAQRGRHLEPDEARAEHHRPAALAGSGHDPTAVGQRAQIVHGRHSTLEGRVEPYRRRAGGQEQRVIGKLGPVVHVHAAARRVDRGGAGAAPELDAALLVEVRRMQRDPLFRGAAGEVVLRQIRPVVRRVHVGIHECNRPRVSLAAQRLGRRVAGRARAEDDHPLGRAGASGWPARGRTLGTDEDAAGPPLDVPARQVIQGRRSQRLARPQAETGMVPGAPHGIADQQPLDQGAAVVAARRADREPFLALSDQQDCLVARVTHDHTAVRDVALRNALGEVRSGRAFLLVGHLRSPGWRSART